jgi:hypothetical protein
MLVECGIFGKRRLYFERDDLELIGCLQGVPFALGDNPKEPLVTDDPNTRDFVD